MSLSCKLEAIKERFENKNATLRILFEQRLDTLRNNIISYISNALNDESTIILNESDTTRGFVVDRILEIVSINLESEKESTIFKLINKTNDLSKKCDVLTIENKELKENNDIFINTQKNIDNNYEELNKLKQDIKEKELKIVSQCDIIKQIDDELEVKRHEMDRIQNESDEQHEHIQTLHCKLENALKNLQNEQRKFDQHSIEYKQMKHINNKNENELKKSIKQIENLRTSLMKSESERLILRKQYIDIGNKLELITNDQNKQIKQFEKQQKDKNDIILSLKNKYRQIMIENESLKNKLHKKTHNLSKKMKEELGKTKILSDDVAVLRKQLESERNINKMYVDQLSKLKMELNEKTIKINKNEKELNNIFSSQKKKIHKYYQKMMDSNMMQLRDEYESHIKHLKNEYDERLIKIQNYEQEKFVNEQSKLLLKMKENEEEYNADKIKLNETENDIKEWMNKLNEYKSKRDGLQKEIEKYQKENENLRDNIISKDNEIKQIKKKQNEEKETFKHLLHEKQKQNQDLSDIIGTLRKQKDKIHENKLQDTAKLNAIQFDLKQNIEHLSFKLQETENKNESIKLKMNEQKTIHQHIEKCNWKYQQKLNVIRGFCRNIRREIRNNKNEIEYIKTSISMSFDRIFHEIQISFNNIETKSAKYILKKENGIKQEIKKSMTEFEKYQNLKLQTIEQKVKSIKSIKHNDDKLIKENLNDINNINMKELDIDQLQNEVDTIRNELNKAKNVLSPKKITFKKISMPSSIDSSMILSSNDKKKEERKIKKPQRYLLNDSYDTATIRKLRNDLQSIETAYKFEKKQTKKQYSSKQKGYDNSLDSSSVLLQS